MYTHINIYVCMYKYANIYIYMYMYERLCARACMCYFVLLFAYICTCACVCVNVCVYVFVYTFIHTKICAYVYLYTYLHTYHCEHQRGDLWQAGAEVFRLLLVAMRLVFWLFVETSFCLRVSVCMRMCSRACNTRPVCKRESEIVHIKGCD